MPDPNLANDKPDVLAYRVGQLENAVREGFEAQSNKIDNLIGEFALTKDLNNAIKVAEDEHIQIWGAIKEIKNNAKWWLTITITACGVLSGIIYTVATIIRDTK